MTEEQFRETMILHMKEQTAFLRGISDGMEAVRMFGRIVKWISGAASAIAGIFGLWSLLTK